MHYGRTTKWSQRPTPSLDQSTDSLIRVADALDMRQVESILDGVDGFSGVVSIDAGVRSIRVARGVADRSTGRANTTDTTFATASAAKTITALVALALVEQGRLSIDTPVANLFVDELPRLHPEITARHLLAHTSGMTDYLDESQVSDIESFELPVPVDELQSPSDYVRLLDLPPQEPPGSAWRYNNGGYVLLSLVCERVGDVSYYDLAQQLVFDPAEMTRSGFFHIDSLPPDSARGYLANGETNRHVLPARGCGDGGLYLTADDTARFWDALWSGAIVQPDTVEAMTSVHHSHDGYHYGWGLWLSEDGRAVSMEGMDAGVSFRSTYLRDQSLSYTVLSNTTRGVWPVIAALDEQLRRVD